MTYVSAVAIDALPKRLGRGKSFDQESADALLAIVSKAGATASDGIAYAEAADARKAAGKARRLLVRVAPDPELVKSRLYEDAGQHRWVVYLAPTPGKPAKAAK